MLNEFDKDLAGIDLSAENASELILAAANKRAEGLSNKNQELLGKVSNNENLSAAEKQKLKELETFKSNAEIQAAKDAEKWNEASELQQQAWAKEKESLVSDADNAKAQLKTLLIDNGLSAALDGVNINKNLKAGAVAMLQAGATITEGKAMIGDKSLSDAVTEWSQTDAGKAFCLAADNSGGDANGGANKGQGKKLTLTEKAIAANQANK